MRDGREESRILRSVGQKTTFEQGIEFSVTDLSVSIKARWIRCVLVFRTARILAWVVLAVVTGLIVRTGERRLDALHGIRVQNDVLYHSVDGLAFYLDIYQPDSPPPAAGRPALIAIHGGGWRGGSKMNYGRSLVPLVRRGYVVIAVDYRLSRPGAPAWPGNLEDVRAAVQWVRTHAPGLGIDSTRLAAIGSSAGAHLALLLGSFSAENSSGVRAVIDFYGPTDLQSLGRVRAPTSDTVNAFLGGSYEAMPGRYRDASPLTHVSRTSPPTFVVHGADDTLVPLEQSILLIEALKDAGVPHRMIVVEGARHGFELKAGKTDFVPEIVAFLENVWNH